MQTRSKEALQKGTRGAMNRALNHRHMARNAIIVHNLHTRRLEKGAKMQRKKYEGTDCARLLIPYEVRTARKSKKARKYGMR